MVAGGRAWLGISQIFPNYSYLSRRIYAACLCLFCTNMALWCIINKPRPLGIFLCVRLIWLRNLVACHWLTGPHSTPYSQIRPKPQYILRIPLDKINNCHLLAVVGGDAHLLQLGWRALTDLLEKQSWDSERHSTKASFGEVQVLHSIAN